MADATVSARETDINITRFTIGTGAQAPGYAIGTPFAIHFSTDTPWGIKFWNGATYQNLGVGLDPTGNATITTFNATRPIHRNRITIGTLAQRALTGYAQNTDQALHFLTNTTWTLSYWNGFTWVNVFLSNTPTADAVFDNNTALTSFQKCTAGTVANRPSYWAGAPKAVHFATGTPYGMSVFDGSAWQDISKYSAP